MIYWKQRARTDKIEAPTKDPTAGKTLAEPLAAASGPGAGARASLDEAKATLLMEAATTRRMAQKSIFISMVASKLACGCGFLTL
ncbi:hypothetical protein ACOSQ2_017532 [Xanthoceras sorbifolium]